MKSDDMIYEALSAVMPTFHLAMDGEPDEAAIYALSTRNYLYESDEPILQRDTYSIIIAQREHSSARVEAIREALQDAGFFVRYSAQNLETYFDAGYSIDTLTASKNIEMEG